ncbi:hypothetical protein RFI_28366 [Reticulomyxa filosa]|uniref:Uncharacterized protein n=1 Tax=Reticulomyxa filosa TaxID=46433 RepID=X6M5V5_RETFI|nr:hypothetical protein RFI_28366 [Reticulomyxa filosa]|eukprot:ETO09021.1 hypothetical protein RFI_28366 [Reticulomyxa filosa]
MLNLNRTFNTNVKLKSNKNSFLFVSNKFYSIFLKKIKNIIQSPTNNKKYLILSYFDNKKPKNNFLNKKCDSHNMVILCECLFHLCIQISRKTYKIKNVSKLFCYQYFKDQQKPPFSFSKKNVRNKIQSSIQFFKFPNPRRRSSFQKLIGIVYLLFDPEQTPSEVHDFLIKDVLMYGGELLMNETLSPTANCEKIQEIENAITGKNNEHYCYGVLFRASEDPSAFEFQSTSVLCLYCRLNEYLTNTFKSIGESELNLAFGDAKFHEYLKKKNSDKKNMYNPLKPLKNKKKIEHGGKYVFSYIGCDTKTLTMQVLSRNCLYHLHIIRILLFIYTYMAARR